MRVLSVVLLLGVAISAVLGQCTLGNYNGCDSSGAAAGITAQIVAQLNASGYSFVSMDPHWV